MENILINLDVLQFNCKIKQVDKLRKQLFALVSDIY